MSTLANILEFLICLYPPGHLAILAVCCITSCSFPCLACHSLTRQAGTSGSAALAGAACLEPAESQVLTLRGCCTGPWAIYTGDSFDNQAQNGIDYHSTHLWVDNWNVAEVNIRTNMES